MSALRSESQRSSDMLRITTIVAVKNVTYWGFFEHIFLRKYNRKFSFILWVEGTTYLHDLFERMDMIKTYCTKR